MTDIPSLVSGEHIAFLDPYTTHLNHSIINKARPGIKIKLVSDKQLKKYKAQFEPYQDMFGCKIQVGTNFEGTLFRLPFRTVQQVIDNNNQGCQMSKKIYNADAVQDLVQSLSLSLDTLLLFSQNVEKVKLFVIKEDGSPSSMTEIISVVKEPVRFMRTIDVDLNHSKSSLFQQQCNILKWTSSILANRVKSSDNFSSIIVQVTTINKTTPTPIKQQQSWLVTSCSGRGAALEMAKSEEGKVNGLLPGGAVAAKLDRSGEEFYPVSIDGEFFCFLPLALPSKLPVHVNGAFAVASNRKDLWRKTSTDPSNVRGIWNDALLKDPISLAYVRMLQDMTDLLHPGQDSER